MTFDFYQRQESLKKVATFEKYISMKKTKILFALLFCTPLILQAQNRYELHETYEIAKKGALTITTEDADVSITGTDRNDVEIHVFREVTLMGISDEEEFEILVEKQDGNLFIRDRKESNNDFFVGYRSIQYTIGIQVPRNIKLYISEDDGDIHIRDMRSSLEVNCEDGDLIIENFDGESVNIMVEDGDIILKEVKGHLTVSTEDGDVLAKNCAFEKVDISTEDGDIVVESALVKKGQYDIKAEDGDVEFGFSGSGAILHLRSDDGSISKTGQFDTITEDEAYAELAFGDTSATISILTEDGRIKVYR